MLIPQHLLKVQLSHPLRHSVTSYLHFGVLQFLLEYQSLLFPFFQRTLSRFPFLLLEHPCQLLIQILHICLIFGVPLAKFCIFRVQLLVPGLQICHLDWDSSVSNDCIYTRDEILSNISFLKMIKRTAKCHSSSRVTLSSRAQLLTLLSSL